MADYTYDDAQAASFPAQNVATLTNWAGAAVSLALVVGVGVWGYKVLARDVSGVPVVQAMAGPMRVAPEDPGGRLADHQGLAVNAVAGNGAAAPPADRLVLAPRPAGLGAEDVALGALGPQVRPAPLRTSLPREAALAEIDPPADIPEDQALASDSTTADIGEEIDPIIALANQLAAGAQPLSALAEGEDKPVVTALADLPELEDAPRPGPGLARSLRPQLRPSRLAEPPARLVAAAEAPAAPGEVDPDTLPVGTRLVQIGAFDSPETARREWQRLEQRFGDYLVDKARVIQRATSGGRVFYRLRAHGFEDLADARRFCAAFVADNVDCIPVVTR